MARRISKTARSRTATPIITDSDLANLYTTSQAAEYLGYTPGGIRKLVQLKKLHPRKIMRDLWFSKDDLDNYNENLRRPRGRPIIPTRSQAKKVEREGIRRRVREHRKKKKA